MMTGDALAATPAFGRRVSTAGPRSSERPWVAAGHASGEYHGERRGVWIRAVPGALGLPDGWMHGTIWMQMRRPSRSGWHLLITVNHKGYPRGPHLIGHRYWSGVSSYAWPPGTEQCDNAVSV